MRVMLPGTGSFANRARFVIHPTKSCVLTYWEQFDQCQNTTYTMNGHAVSQVDHTKHLGVHRELNNKANITGKIALLIPWWVLGFTMEMVWNGLKQSVCGKLWSTYVVPRFTYGLEVLNLKGSELKLVEQFQRKSLRQIQSLPDKNTELYRPCAPRGAVHWTPDTQEHAQPSWSLDYERGIWMGNCPTPVSYEVYFRTHLV